MNSLTDRPSIVAILGRRAADVATSEDLVEWAVEELTGELDSPSLRRLAGLTRPLCWSEVALAFEMALEELGVPEPPPQEAVRRYVTLLARQLAAGEMDPVRVCGLLHPLAQAPGADDDLSVWSELYWAWDDLSLGRDTHYYPVPREKLREAVRREAVRWLQRQDSAAPAQR
jgi:hypothetical protein